MAQSDSRSTNSDNIASRPTARAEAASTHPATLIALATLLVNDLVFKSLWPGSWITGKLSDLAWVIFASPLLALPLTFLARRNRNAQRTAWAIAYIGLPLLYAAYNTFEPLHDAVMAGFSFLRGTPGGSPFDPTDSVVIPFGVAAAIWVWRNAKVGAKPVRIRLAILVAAVAAVASLASSVVTTSGVTAIGATANGTIIAADLQGIARIYFASEDGGFTWDSVSGAAHSDITWGQSKVDTPRGKYEVVGASVEKTADGRKSKVLVPPIADNSKHSRAIRAATIDFGVKRRVTPVFDAILYDTHTGNVIVTNGLQGVVVETPDGEWRRVDVAGYKPHRFLAVREPQTPKQPHVLADGNCDRIRDVGCAHRLHGDDLTIWCASRLRQNYHLVDHIDYNFCANLDVCHFGFKCHARVANCAFDSGVVDSDTPNDV